MARFEYQIIRFTLEQMVDTGAGFAARELDHLASEGWELVALSPEQGQTDNYIAVFKRALSN